MNELQKYMLEKQISLTEASIATGKPRDYCMMARNGQLVNEMKVREFLSLLKNKFK